jgi:hypothetical protein
MPSGGDRITTGRIEKDHRAQKRMCGNKRRSQQMIENVKIIYTKFYICLIITT